MTEPTTEDAIRRAFLDELIFAGIVTTPMSYDEIRAALDRLELRWRDLTARAAGIDAEALALALRDHAHVGNGHGAGCAEDIAARYDEHAAIIAAEKERP
jgi:hypothetical protein